MLPSLLPVRRKYTAKATLSDVNIAYVNTLLDEALELAGLLNGVADVRSDSWDFADLLLQSTVELRTAEAYGVNVPELTAQVSIQRKTLSSKILTHRYFKEA